MKLTLAELLFSIFFKFFYYLRLGISTGISEPDEEIPHFEMVSPHILKSLIENKFSNYMSSLYNELQNVDFMCCTADIWSTKHKSYMGITCHYIDENTLERKSKLLCCRRFMSPHDNERIAELISEVYREFDITFKVVGTVTDNASNFALAFKKYGLSIDEFNMLNKATKVDEFNDIFRTIFNENENDNDDKLSISEDETIEVEFVGIDDSMLSSHFRCAAHTLSLVGTKDANDALKDHSYLKHFNSAFSKVNILCKKNNRPKSSESIVKILGKSVPTPCITR